MTKATFKGQDLDLVLNNYRLFKIAEELEVETPVEAIEAINDVLTKPEGGVLKASTMKGFAVIFKHMVLEGASKAGKPAPKFSDSDWFDILSDDASGKVVEEFFAFLPPMETVKKKQVAEKV